MVTRIAHTSLHRALAAVVLILGLPLTPLFAAAGFAWSVYLLPIEFPGPSVVGERIARALGRPYEMPLTGCIFPDFVNFNPEKQRMKKEDDAQYVMYLRRSQEDTGFWAVATHTRRVDIFLLATNNQPLGAAEPALRTAAVHFYRYKINDEQLAKCLRERDFVETSIIWKGWLHNAASLAFLNILVISVPMVISRRRIKSRIRRHLCPHCAYDLRATPASAPCPECGRTP